MNWKEFLKHVLADSAVALLMIFIVAVVSAFVFIMWLGSKPFGG